MPARHSKSYLVYITKLAGVNQYQMVSDLWWSPATVQYSPANSETTVSAMFGSFQVAGTLAAPTETTAPSLTFEGAATPWYFTILPPPMPPTPPPPSPPSPSPPAREDLSSMNARWLVPATDSIGVMVDSIASVEQDRSNNLVFHFDPVRATSCSSKRGDYLSEQSSRYSDM